MTKKELVTMMAEKLETTKKEANTILTSVTDCITEGLVSDGEVKLVGFGKFVTVDKPERECRNPKTGETITVEAKTIPKFKYSKVLREAVNT
jgi:DNA-binding protein HU-beta